MDMWHQKEKKKNSNGYVALLHHELWSLSCPLAWQLSHTVTSFPQLQGYLRVATQMSKMWDAETAAIVELEAPQGP